MGAGKTDPKLWAYVTVVVAVIGCTGTIIAASIAILPDVIDRIATATSTSASLNIVTPSLVLPTPILTQELPTLEPQEVDWVPYDEITGTGLRILGSDEFIPWQDLKEDLEQNVLTQVRNIPPGSTLELADLGEQQNWIIQVIGPSGEVVAHVWIGNDPLDGWDFDGLIRVGSHMPPNEVWATFQRYSDGSYRKQ